MAFAPVASGDLIQAETINNLVSGGPLRKRIVKYVKAQRTLSTAAMAGICQPRS